MFFLCCRLRSRPAKKLVMTLTKTEPQASALKVAPNATARSRPVFNAMLEAMDAAGKRDRAHCTLRAYCTSQLSERSCSVSTQPSSTLPQKNQRQANIRTAVTSMTRISSSTPQAFFAPLSPLRPISRWCCSNLWKRKLKTPRAMKKNFPTAAMRRMGRRRTMQMMDQRSRPMTAKSKRNHEYTYFRKMQLHWVHRTLSTYTAVLTVIPMSKIQKKSHTLRTESMVDITAESTSK
mmetsp:Transcript_9482/g.21012  ORF Transcript_9482/g.21012 Transcript_9482/m.21012 type:complete len:235 (+) Transcript_9482:770-1474(+)